MKELDELQLPEELRYSKDHEWVKSLDGDLIRAGITDYAQDQLGDIVFVDLPEEGDAFEEGEEFATVESVKAVSEAYIPIGGEVVKVNSELDDSPELLNTDPYGAGWLIEMKLDDPADLEGLLTHDAYLKLLQEESSASE